VLRLNWFHLFKEPGSRTFSSVKMNDFCQQLASTLCVLVGQELKCSHWYLVEKEVRWCRWRASLHYCRSFSDTVHLWFSAHFYTHFQYVLCDFVYYHHDILFRFSKLNFLWISRPYAWYILHPSHLPRIITLIVEAHYLDHIFSSLATPTCVGQPPSRL
jgi:hypothetical protein